MWKPASAALAVCLAAIPGARAATCDEEIRLFAEQHDLLAELPRAEPPSGALRPPATTESRGVPQDALSRSGGVIEPPAQGRTPTIEPPLSGADVMPTRPAIRPHTSERPSSSAAEVSGAKRLQMQSLLNGARAAAREGKEAECFRRLGEARAIPEPG